MDPIKYESLRNSTLLFFIEKLIDLEENVEENRKRTLHDLSCQFGSKGFTKEMRQIAGGSQSGLKKFLSDYPSIFEIDGDVVMYRDTSFCREKVVDPSSSDYGKEAVEYFRERLIQYGVGVWVPVKSLLGHRSQAPTEVRHVSGQHINEFTKFLLNNGEIFKLNSELDSVLLKEFENREESSKEVLLPVSIDREKILKLIEFYGNCLQERGPMSVEQLFHASAVAFNDNFITTPNDLRSFFQIHSRCFSVHGSMVSCSDSYMVGLEYLQRRQQTIQPTESTTNVQLKPLMSVPSPTPEIIQKIPIVENSLKTRFSKILMKTLTENAELNQKPKRLEIESKFEELCCLGDEEQLKNYIVNRTLIVSNVRKGKIIIDELINNLIVSLDCEGINLGDSNTGKITLIQIGNINGNSFIFDVLTQPGLINEIKHLLEADTVKVMHDCRNDSVNLYREFGIRLRNVFDTQAAHVVIQMQSNTEEVSKIKNISLNNLCNIYYKNVLNPFKDKIKGVYRHDQRYWSRRPLTKQMISYASCDVLCLVPYVYNEMNGMIVNEQDKKLMTELTEEQILAHIQPEEIRQRRRMRKNEGDLEELKTKIETAIRQEDVLSRDLVLSNREMRLLKHLELSDLAKEKLKTSLKVAKKLEKMERLSSNPDSSTNSSELTSLEYSSCNNNIELDRIQQIDNLEAIINDIIGDNVSTNIYSKGEMNDAAVQTNSTGDIVVMKVYEDF